MANHKRSRVTAGLLAAALFAAGCSETTGDDVVADPTNDSTPTETSTETTDPMAEASAETQWALDYTGGTHEAAAGGTVKIGYVSSEAFFPSSGQAVKDAATFINAELGGIQGSQIEIVTCDISTPDAGGTCGAEFANDDEINLVIMGPTLVGNSSFYQSTGGNTSVMITTPLDIADYGTPSATSYYGGALGAAVGGALFVGSALKPSTAAIVLTNDAAGQSGASILVPTLEQFGVEVNTVFVEPTSTSPEIASALTASGADTADVLVLGLFDTGCIAAYDALQSLGLNPPVVTTGACWSIPMQEHMKNIGADTLVPEGWYFTNGGYNPFTPSLESGDKTILTKLEEYGDISTQFDVGVQSGFATLLSATAILNQVGAGQDFATTEGAIRTFTGPAPQAAGNVNCNPEYPVFKAICSSKASVHQFTADGWVDIAAGDSSIDYTPILMAPAPS